MVQKSSFKYFIGYNDNDVLDHYALSFHKWLAMLENLNVIQQCLSRLATNNCEKGTIKYGKKLKKC